MRYLFSPSAWGYNISSRVFGIVFLLDKRLWHSNMPAGAHLPVLIRSQFWITFVLHILESEVLFSISLMPHKEFPWNPSVPISLNIAVHSEDYTLHIYCKDGPRSINELSSPALPWGRGVIIGVGQTLWFFSLKSHTFCKFFFPTNSDILSPF